MLPTHAVQVFRERPNRRGTVLWQFLLHESEKVTFDSKEIAVRIYSRESASWLAEQVQLAIRNGGFPTLQGHPVTPENFPKWTGDLNDDCALTTGSLYAHAEWCSGSRRGGNWACYVVDQADQNRFLFHTADTLITPKNGVASRWLCELVMVLHQNDLQVALPPRQSSTLHHRERPA